MGIEAAGERPIHQGPSLSPAAPGDGGEPSHRHGEQNVATHDHEAAERLDMREVGRVVFVAVAAVAVWFRLWEPFGRISVIGLAATVIGGWPIFAEAWENLRERRMTMELSMTIALLAALVIGEFFTALVITAFVLVAEILEGLTVERGRRAIRTLLDFLPPTATVRRQGGTETVALAKLRIGDHILIAPGALVPADGVVIAGESFVDQATITGESTPARKVADAPVYAGTINQSGALEVRVEHIGSDTSFGKIVEAVERAERSRAPVQKTADRLAGYLVYFALACAAITFALTRDARSTISVIIVAGACGIAAGTPLAVLGAIGRAAREGAIIKGGRYLEALWSVDVIAFDKTGTVTLGAPVVRSSHPFPGVSESRLILTAAIAERRSEHPLGTAIVRYAEALGMTVTEPQRFEYTPGRGVSAYAGGEEILVGNRDYLAGRGMSIDVPTAVAADGASTVVFVARAGRLLGTVTIADAIRPEAPDAFDHLRSMGIRTVVLSGDARSVAEAVGRELGADAVRGELLPDDKVTAVDRLAADGRVVAMVGDGVNDAPALAHAAVGVAMGSGTDVARESADIVLLGNDLGKFVETVRVARRARGIIRFNFAGTLTVDALGVGLAAFGYLNPLLAAFIHVASEMTFILNSARLLPAGARHASQRG